MGGNQRLDVGGQKFATANPSFHLRQRYGVASEVEVVETEITIDNMTRRRRKLEVRIRN
jgi:hypothetical protein